MKIELPLLFIFTFFLDFAAQSQSLPHLMKKGYSQQLIVQDQPYLILGGELGNSTASSMEYMQPAWDKLSAMHLNTILAPVYWELMEPEEGKFDFALVDKLIAASAKKNLKVILLWFGSWKNSMSCYVPAWVKTNQ